MRVEFLEEDKMYKMCDHRFNAPIVLDQKEENHFQAEIRNAYQRLVERLSIFGTEGDFYGVSDFAVTPDLTDRPSVTAPPAAHDRQLYITILSRAFYDSAYIPAIVSFLADEPTDYRICITQDFDPNWVMRFFVTRNLAQLYCTDEKELSKYAEIFSSL